MNEIEWKLLGGNENIMCRGKRKTLPLFLRGVGVTGSGAGYVRWEDLEDK